MHELLKEGLKRKLIRFDDDGKYIVYVRQNQRRNYSNPEEKVQVDAFLQLILTYNYPVEHVRLFVPIQMGVATKEADLVVYNDPAHKSPHIVVECKRETVSEQEFARAADQ